MGQTRAKDWHFYPNSQWCLHCCSEDHILNGKWLEIPGLSGKLLWFPARNFYFLKFCCGSCTNIASPLRFLILMSPYMQLDFYWFGYKKLLLIGSQIAKSQIDPNVLSHWNIFVRVSRAKKKKKKKKSFLRHSLFYFFFLFKILSQNNLHYINRTFCWFWHRNEMTTIKDTCSLQQAGWFLSTCMVLVCLLCMESFYFIPHFKS